MNSTHFTEAKRSYEKGDYADALKSYYACLKEDSGSFAPGDLGLTYHMLGNCLVKLKRFSDAADIFEKALADEAYDRKGAVHANLGIALIGCERYEDAISSFSVVTADPTYPTPYRAYSGLGNANMKLGRYADAGMAYRNAALDEHNPHPVKALTSLGECFTLLGRPEDAIATLNTALDFDISSVEEAAVREQLGRAQHAAGREEEAVASFEAALAGGDYALSDDGQADYEAAQAALDPLSLVSDGGAGEGEEDLFAGLDADPLEEGGEYDYAQDPYGAPIDDGYGDYDDGYGDNQEMSLYSPDGDYYDDEGYYGDEGEDGFFAPQDDAFEETGKKGKKGKKAKKDKKSKKSEAYDDPFDESAAKPKRHVGLKILLVFIILLVLALGGGFYAYWVGYGYPTQEDTIEGLFAANAAGQDVSEYWCQEDKSVIDNAMDCVAKTNDITIDSVERSTVKSTAFVTASLPTGGKIRYQVDLMRSGGVFGIDALAIGWKVSNIDFAFASTQNGSTQAMSVGTVSGGSSSSSTQEPGEPDEGAGSEETGDGGEEPNEG